MNDTAGRSADAARPPRQAVGASFGGAARRAPALVVPGPERPRSVGRRWRQLAGVHACRGGAETGDVPRRRTPESRRWCSRGRGGGGTITGRRVRPERDDGTPPGTVGVHDVARAWAKTASRRTCVDRVEHRTDREAAACTCYCMHMLSRRLQVLLDDDRYDRLARHASERGTSIATLVREAIDSRFPLVENRRGAAAEAILAAEAMDVPDDAADLKREIAATRAGRW